MYLHGATGNAMLRSLAEGEEICVTVTLLVIRFPLDEASAKVRTGRQATRPTLGSLRTSWFMTSLHSESMSSRTDAYSGSS